MLPRGVSFSGDVGPRLVDSGLSVVVTGSGGWLGRVTLEMLASALGQSFDSLVYAFGSRRAEVTLRSGASVKVHPLAELQRLEIGPHFLAHYAFLTREKLSELPVTDYLAANQEIREIVVAHIEQAPLAGMFVPSSGAVYRADRTLDDDIAANPYGVLKHRDEQRFIGLAEAGRVERLVCARIFNLAGPGLNKPGHYVLGSIIEDIIRGGPIRLRSTRPVIRSYVHVMDLINLAFRMMLGSGPLPPDPFDTAGEGEIEIGGLAAATASLMGVSGMEVVRPALDSLVPDRYVGDGRVMAAMAASCGLALCGLETQIIDTADYLMGLGSTTEGD